MDRAATKDILLIELNNSFISIISFHHKSKKNITKRAAPKRITINPLIVQFGLLYIKERLGPTNRFTLKIKYRSENNEK